VTAGAGRTNDAIWAICLLNVTIWLVSVAVASLTAFIVLMNQTRYTMLRPSITK